ncbi:hypothetical protein [uncultured Bifidobacterium sp.]|uniref:hypothetical protein n=1 Tax=uncultured Bifidobacterium sp. TaxID=165187 RepID=UPI002595381E|nr:hypothetical protein [uncultured Bifidobacterium sp.]
MTTTTHDTSISWMDCPVCAELHREVERADAEADKAWETYSSVDFQYREVRDDGRVGFGTKAWTQWHDLLDQLLHAYYDAADAHRARLEAWGESIREHDEPQTTAETPERKVTISKADAADELVNVYGGHIDQWLKALRERSFAQAAEPMPRDRDAYERLWYGDVPEITLPPSFAGLDAMTLTHCARAIGFYLRVLKQYAPVSDDASHVAHRLMDAFDDAAEARETALAGGEGEEK